MITIDPNVLQRLPQVANSQEAWDKGSRTCWYREDGMPEDMVMLCNREQKGTVERTKVNEVPTHAVVDLPKAPPARGVRRMKRKHTGSKKGATHKQARKAKGIAPPAMTQATSWRVWQKKTKGGRMRYVCVAQNLSYSAACAQAAALPAAVVRATSSPRPSARSGGAK